MRVRGQSCKRQRCSRPPRIDGLCKKHAVEEADRLFSLAIRSIGRCEVEDRPHMGSLQCAHGFSRSYKAVRWDSHNAWCLCAGCHVYYTHHPIEWDLWMLDRMGVAVYAEVRERALSHCMPDLELVLAELRANA